MPEIPTDFDTSFADNFFLKQAFKSIFKLELNEETLMRLFYPFITGKFAINYDHLISLTKESEENREAVADIGHFLDSVSNEFNLPLINKEKLILELFNVYHLNFGQSYLLYDKKKIFLNSFLEDAPYATELIYESIQRASPLIDGFSHHEVNELAYIFITHWDGFADVITVLKPQFKAGIFMDTDVEHAKFIATKLNSTFTEEIHFEVILAPTVEDMFELSNSYAFIVTNISNFPDKKVPFICIGMTVTSKDIHHITNFYTELVAKEQHPII